MPSLFRHAATARGPRHRGRGAWAAAALLLGAAATTSSSRVWVPPPPRSSRGTSQGPLQNLPGLAGSTASLSLGLPLAAWANAAQDEFDYALYTGTQLQVPTEDGGTAQGELTKPTVDEASLKLSEFVSEAGKGITSGNLDYGSKALGDTFAEIWERMSSSVEDGEIPWDQIGGFFLLAVVIANVATFLSPIFQSFLDELQQEEAPPPVPPPRPRRPPVSPEEISLKLPPKPEAEPDLTLPAREAAEGPGGGASATSK